MAASARRKFGSTGGGHLSLLQQLDIKCLGSGPDGSTFRFTEERLRRLRELGELGQLILGLRAGYSVAEIAEKREWTESQCADVYRRFRETDWSEWQHGLTHRHKSETRKQP